MWNTSNSGVWSRKYVPQSSQRRYFNSGFSLRGLDPQGHNHNSGVMKLVMHVCSNCNRLTTENKWPCNDAAQCTWWWPVDRFSLILVTDTSGLEKRSPYWVNICSTPHTIYSTLICRDGLSACQVSGFVRIAAGSMLYTLEKLRHSWIEL